MTTESIVSTETIHVKYILPGSKVQIAMNEVPILDQLLNVNALWHFPRTRVSSVEVSSCRLRYRLATNPRHISYEIVAHTDVFTANWSLPKQLRRDQQQLMLKVSVVSSKLNLRNQFLVLFMATGYILVVLVEILDILLSYSIKN